MSFAVVIEGMTLIAYIVILAGGKQKRETGWKILVVLLGLGGAILCAAMAIVAYLYDNDDRFFVGWKLDVSWILDTVSWSVLVLSALVVGGAAMLLPSEGGYELIPGGEF
ncbi:MAG: hypothetical protein M1834_007931 [Cirrosporium novae-zelandiae]|nr:MAG: hypothetical protein M1834_007931 [Cirrosporium novae-zelandiae]